MINNFKNIPFPLQKQIFVRIGFGFVFTLVFILLLFIDNGLYTILAGIAIILLCLGSALLLFLRSTNNEYIIVSGECIDTQRTLLKQRVKLLFLKCGEYTVQVAPRQRLRRIPPGTMVDLYVSSSTPVYERDGFQVLHSYLAMELKGEAVQSDAGRGDPPQAE